MFCHCLCNSRVKPSLSKATRVKGGKDLKDLLGYLVFPSGQSVGYRAELSVSCFAASSLVGLNLGWFTTLYTEQIHVSREQP